MFDSLGSESSAEAGDLPLLSSGVHETREGSPLIRSGDILQCSSACLRKGLALERCIAFVEHHGL